MHQKIVVTRGDITKMYVDAIVNAANSSLMGGSGVDGAIHRAGGPRILDECRAIVARQGGCPTGEAVITSGGNLLARYVIHTVGPVWRGGHHDEHRLLEACYRNSLQLAVEHGCKTVAFPNISTGAYDFPKQQAAAVAVRAVSNFLSLHEHPDKVYLVCFDEENYAFTSQALAGYSAR